MNCSQMHANIEVFTRFRHIALGGLMLALLSLTSVGNAQAQGYEEWVPRSVDGRPAIGGGGGLMMFDAGDVWFRANAADKGLGYEGSYLSTGAVIELFSDKYEGWWLFDGRAHVSDQGNFFMNTGLVRREYFLDAMLGAGVWYSFDADEAEIFGHQFHEIAFSLEVLKDEYQLRANAYLPVGETNYTMGSPFDDSCFFENLLLEQSGIDSALTGFDVKLTIPDQNLCPLPTTIDIGGYYYESDVVEPFAGISVGVNTYISHGFAFGVQVNHDERFDTTGLLSLQINFGGSPGLGIDVHERSPVRRNDHIVRYHRDPIVAISPVTGLAYHVVHVDNSNDGAVATDPNGDGTFENPFNQLALAEPASGIGDIIFVNEGDGTTDGYDLGITLQNDQLLLGDGFEHIIPLAGGGEFTLCNDVDGLKPTITNSAGPGVTLADRNTVSGFTIDGAETGILGTGIDSAEISNVMVMNSTLDGITLMDATGTVSITDSMINTNGIGNRYGVFANVDGTAGVADLDLTISGSTVDGNGTGIYLEAEGSMATLDATITENDSISDNRADGIHVEGMDGADIELTISDNLAISRNGTVSLAGRGIFMHAQDASITADISGNTLEDNFFSPGGGANVVSGIEGLFQGDSNFDVTVTDNMVSATNSTDTGSDLFRMLAEITNINEQSLVVTDNIFTDATSRGVVIDMFDDTVLAAEVSDNIITGSSGNSTRIEAFGSSVFSLDFNNNDVTGGAGQSIFVTGGAGRMIASITSNIFTDNGTGAGDQGVQIETNGVSTMVVDFLNNDVNLNADGGVELSVFDTSAMYAFVRNNDMTDNGVGQADFYAEIDAGAAAGALLCLELNNNVTVTGYDLVNSSAAATFNLEDDGTNVPVTPMTTGTITPVADGTCEAAAAPFRAFP